MTIAEVELPAATSTTNTAMKALVYHGPDKRVWKDKPRPSIQAG